MNDWISIKERMPEERFVLVALDCYPRIVMESEFYADVFHRMGGDYGEITCVTHWMPLPDPPKGRMSSE